jgi:hypothetical protein
MRKFHPFYGTSGRGNPGEQVSWGKARKGELIYQNSEISVRVFNQPTNASYYFDQFRHFPYVIVHVNV